MPADRKAPVMLLPDSRVRMHRCRCGHDREAHEHYRRGSDCCQCACRRWRSVAWWEARRRAVKGAQVAGVCVAVVVVVAIAVVAFAPGQ